MIFSGLFHSQCSADFRVKKVMVEKLLDTMGCRPYVEGIIKTEVDKLFSEWLATKKVSGIQNTFESFILRLTMCIVNGKLYAHDDKNFQEILKTFRMNAEFQNNKWDSYESLRLLKRCAPSDVISMQQRTELLYAYQRDVVNR